MDGLHWLVFLWLDLVATTKAMAMAVVVNSKVVLAAASRARVMS